VPIRDLSDCSKIRSQIGLFDHVVPGLLYFQSRRGCGGAEVVGPAPLP
jgi:hypothetical protein